MGEAEYLAQQAEKAQKAIAASLADLKSDLVHEVDLRIWMQSHPWMTLASAAVAGFAAAATVVPSKEQQALRKLHAIEKAIHSAHNKAAAEGNGSTAPKHDGGIAGLILRELVTAIKPALLALLTARMAPPSPPPEQPDPAPDASTGSDAR